MPRSGLDSDAVVTAAAALADAEGLQAVTLAKVAAQLGVKSPSLYVHVDGFSGLRRQIAARGARELTAAMQVGRRRALRPRGARRARGRLPRVRPRAPGDLRRHAERGEPRGARGGGGRRGGARCRLRRAARLRARGEDAAIHAARVVRSALHGFVSLEVGAGFGIDLDLDQSFALLVAMLDRGLRAGVRLSSAGQYEPGRRRAGVAVSALRGGDRVGHDRAQSRRRRRSRSRRGATTAPPAARRRRGSPTGASARSPTRGDGRAHRGSRSRPATSARCASCGRSCG